jgi:hypothetical protein
MRRKVLAPEGCAKDQQQPCVHEDHHAPAAVPAKSAYDRAATDDGDQYSERAMQSLL